MNDYHHRTGDRFVAMVSRYCHVYRACAVVSAVVEGEPQDVVETRSNLVFFRCKQVGS